MLAIIYKHIEMCLCQNRMTLLVNRWYAFTMANINVVLLSK